jgi:predicted DNA binding protein
VLAFENGLLDIPAKARMDRVARGEGVSRSTFGEHLRKAQLQLIRNSYPFLKLRDDGVKQE